MSSRLTSSDVVAWLREHARKLNEAADQIENTFRALVMSQAAALEVQNPPPTTATPDAIKELLKTRNARPADIAREWGLAESHIRAVIAQPHSGLTIADRGWVKVVDESAA